MRVYWPAANTTCALAYGRPCMSTIRLAMNSGHPIAHCTLRIQKQFRILHSAFRIKKSCSLSFRVFLRFCHIQLRIAHCELRFKTQFRIPHSSFRVILRDCNTQLHIAHYSLLIKNSLRIAILDCKLCLRTANEWEVGYG